MAMAFLHLTASSSGPSRGASASDSQIQSSSGALNHANPVSRRAVIIGPAFLAIGLASRAQAADGLPANEQEWKQKLSPLAYYVMREGGTERQFTCREFLQEKRPGTFVCAGCETPLFDVKDKFDSGTGWPSFLDRVGGDGGFVSLKVTPWDAFNMRAECRCKKCNSHLGHRFPDGPEPTGMRYCINGVALAFVPE